MRSISSHLSIILSMFMLLFTFQCASMVKRVVNGYEKSIVDDYAIVLVASTELDTKAIHALIPTMTELQEISSKKILDRLKNDMSSKNLTLLQVALPKFYSLKLSSIPSKEGLEALKERLKSIASITRVETFAKTHEKIFKMFVLLQSIVYFFSGFSGFLALLLIFKQVRVWTYEHQRRMSIMSLFGASFFMKSAMLYRMTLVDALVGALLVCAIFATLPYNIYVQAVVQDLGIVIPPFDLVYEGGILFGIAIFCALLSVSMVARKVGRV